MQLSWNEIRSRAAAFAKEWHGEGYERGQTQTFYNEFFEVFGIARKRVAIYEQPIKDLADNKRGFIDLYWKGVLLIEQKSQGLDLAGAKKQAFDYLPGIKNDKDLPNFILLSDFQRFELFDLNTGKDWKFGLQELPEKVQAFSFMFGGVQREFKDEDPVNIEASELMGDLYDALKASGYEGHDLERFLVRLVFCLFADDTGIFQPRGILLDYIDTRTTEDGADLGPKLTKLFEVLNQPDEKRAKTLDEELAAFPYVNGELFAERLPLPDFNSRMRAILIEACEFNWSKVSPAIFGSLFQSVMDKKKRRAVGAHYTNEQNIMKVIGPLFLDDLKADLKRLLARKDNSRAKALAEFQERLSKLTFFDPACGCGNFLVIAYREIRKLEHDIILDRVNNKDLFAGTYSNVDVNQFYGIEIEEFPARIAETAMWMMDHIMNMQLSESLGQYLPRIPLKKSPKIVHGDALELDWAEVLNPKDCSYVFGNPPFIGAKLQTEEQRKHVHRIANLGKKKGTLDFVCCWFLKAGAFVNAAKEGTSPPASPDPPQRGGEIPLSFGEGARRAGEVPFPSIAFVATNSISQGEQVAELWPLMFNRYGLEIAFAHRTFAWGSEARGKANVHVVIVGLTKREDEPVEKRLFDYDDIKGDPTETKVRAISPYLFDGSFLGDRHTVVRESERSISHKPPLITGSQLIDDGNYIFSRAEKNNFIGEEPKSSSLFRPFVGGEEFINGGDRWLLLAQAASPSELRSLPKVCERIEAVKKFRLKSKRAGTIKLAATPTLFQINEIPKRNFLLIPEVSSETRDYVPIGYLKPPTVPSNLVRIIPDATIDFFSLLTSRMHMSWLRFIGGRLKSDYRYSIGLVYNPFPWPDLDPAKKEKLTKLGQAILDARELHPQSTLADLYDPLTMPANLRKAHEANDKAVDQLYRKVPFKSDRERVEFLLARYEQITAPALALAAQKPKRIKKNS